MVHGADVQETWIKRRISSRPFGHPRRVLGVVRIGRISQAIEYLFVTLKPPESYIDPRRAPSTNCAGIVA